MASEIEPIRIPLLVDLQRLDQDMERVERDARVAGRRTGEAFGVGSAEVGGFERSVKGAATAVGGLAIIVANQGVSAMRGFIGWIGKTTTGLLDFGAIGLLKVSQGLRVMAEETRDAEGELTVLGKTGIVASTGLEAVAKVALTVSGAILGLQVGAALLGASLVVASSRAGASFTPAWNRVLVTLNKSKDEVIDLRSTLLELSGTLGVESVVAADTFYEIMGAMPSLLAEPARAMDTLQVSLEAGTTGFTDAATAAKAIAAVLSAFNLEAEEARRVSDALFTAQALGATTFGEIAASISGVSGLTAALGGEFEDLLGIIATLTPTGTSTSEIVTQIGGAISNIIKPSAEAAEAAAALGIEFNATALQAKGLNQFLTEIIVATKGQPDILAQLFGGRQALALMVALVDKTEELDDLTQQIRLSAGATSAAVETMNDSWSRQREILGGQLSSVLTEIGLKFEAVGTAGLEAANTIIGRFRDVLKEMGDFDAETKRIAEAMTEQALTRQSILRGAPRPAGSWFATDNISIDPTRLPDNLSARAFNRQPAIPGIGARAPFSMRPPPLPPEEVTLESAQEKIATQTALLQARAVADMAATGNAEAYEAATRRAQEQVNQLVISEMERLRAGGLEEGQVAQLAASYRVLTDNRAEEIARIREQAEAITGEMAMALAGLTETASDEALLNLDRFEEEIRSTFEKLGEEIPPALAAGIAKQRQAILDAARLEDLRGQADEMLLGEASPAMVLQLEEFIRLLEGERDALEEGTEVRARYVDMVRQMERALESVNREVANAREELLAEAEAAAEAEQKQREDLIRSGQKRIENLREEHQVIMENVSAALEMADAFGVIDSEAAKTLQNVVQLGLSLSRLAAGDPTAAIGVMGALAGIGASIFGESQAEKDRREILERNQETLERIEANTRGLQQTSTNLKETREFLGRFLKSNDPEVAFAAQVRRAKEFPGTAGAMEVTRIEDLAKQFGIDLYDDLGVVIEGSLDMLVRAIILAEEALTGWGNSLNEQRQRADLEADIFDLPQDAVSRLTKEFEYLAKFAPNLIKAFKLGDLDLSSTEGRSRLEAALREMFKGFSDGTIDIGNLTREDFLSWLGNIEGFLDEVSGELGETQSFQVSRSITEITGNRIYAALTTGNLYQQMIAQNTALMNEALRAGLAGRQIPAGMQAEASLLSAPAGVVNTFGDINVSVVATPGSSAEDVGRMAGTAIVDAVDEQLGRRYQQMRRYRGDNRA